MLERLDSLIAVSVDAGVAGLLERNLPPERGLPEHYRATDLCNPAQAFYDRLGHKPPESVLLQRRKKYGTIVHHRFAQGIRPLPDFHAEEALLDGALVDVPGITGKIDHRFQDSLVELKSTPYLIETPDDVWRLMPQNVAQLLIYAAIWPKQGQVHYLVVLPVEEKNGRPVHHPLRVFKIRIQDVPLLRRATSALLGRMKDAVASKDPTGLGKCAYYDNECPFQQQKICACDGKPSHLKDWLGRGVEVTREPALEPEWEKALATPATRSLHPFELAVPRKYYAAAKSDFDHFGGFYGTGDARQKLREAAYRAKVAATPDDLRSLEWGEEPAPRLSVLWLRVPKTKALESRPRLVPAVLKDWTEGTPTPRDVKWQAWQVAAVAAYHGLPEGMVLVLGPKDIVYGFKVALRHPGTARDLVMRSIQTLRAALEQGKPETLPACPSFMQTDCKLPACLCAKPTAKLVPKTPMQTAKSELGIESRKT